MPSQWAGIVGGDWPTTGHAYPVWAADGLRTADSVGQLCTNARYKVTGGQVLMAQWVDNYGTKTSLDHDYAC